MRRSLPPRGGRGYPRGSQSTVIAPSKLGRLVEECWHSGSALPEVLRQQRLVRANVSDEDLEAAVNRALIEDATLPSGQRECNSPNERVRVFLEPFLTARGRLWAEPLRSLRLADGDARKPWWKVWT